MLVLFYFTNMLCAFGVHISVTTLHMECVRSRNTNYENQRKIQFSIYHYNLVAAHIIITSFDILAIIITSFGILTIIITSLAKGKRTKRQTTIHKTQHRKLKINQHEPHKNMLGYLDRIVFLDYVVKSFNFVRTC